MKRRLIAASLLLAISQGFVSAAHAGEDDIDRTFGPNGNGRVVIPFDLGSDNEDVATDVVVYPDRSLAVVGRMLAADREVIGVVHLAADGAPHPQWQRTILDAGSGVVLYATAAALQPDGGLVIAGSYITTQDFELRWIACRINADGSPDNTFGNDVVLGACMTTFAGGSEMPGEINDVAIQSSGRIVFAGYYQDGATRRAALSSLLPNGTPDFTFADDDVGQENLAMPYPAGAANSEFTAITLDQGNAFAAAGVFGNSDGDTDFLVTSYDATGTLKPGFGEGGRVIKAINFGAPGTRNDRAEAVAFSGSDILVGGNAQTGAAGGVGAVARFESNGLADMTFGQGGIAKVNAGEARLTINDMTTRVDGSVVVAGRREDDDGHGYIDQLAPDGTDDATFTAIDLDFHPEPPANLSNSSSIQAIATQADQLIVVGYGAAASTQAPNIDIGVARIGDDSIFVDGFEGTD